MQKLAKEVKKTRLVFLLEVILVLTKSLKIIDNLKVTKEVI